MDIFIEDASEINIYITADTRYKLYINDKHVVAGNIQSQCHLATQTKQQLLYFQRKSA